MFFRFIGKSATYRKKLKKIDFFQKTRTQIAQFPSASNHLSDKMSFEMFLKCWEQNPIAIKVFLATAHPIAIMSSSLNHRISTQTNKKQSLFKKVKRFPTILECIDKYNEKRSRIENDTKVTVTEGPVDGVSIDQFEKHLEYVLGEAVQTYDPNEDLIVLNFIMFNDKELVVMFFRKMGVEVVLDTSGAAIVLAITGSKADVKALGTMLFK